MNASTFDFSGMTLQELLNVARNLALELWERSGPVKVVVVHIVTRVKSWFI
jgi:hypothetical protein